MTFIEICLLIITIVVAGPTALILLIVGLALIVFLLAVIVEIIIGALQLCVKKAKPVVRRFLINPLLRAKLKICAWTSRKSAEKS